MCERLFTLSCQGAVKRLGRLKMLQPVLLALGDRNIAHGPAPRREAGSLCQPGSVEKGAGNAALTLEKRRLQMEAYTAGGHSNRRTELASGTGQAAISVRAACDSAAVPPSCLEAPQDCCRLTKRQAP